MTNRAALIFMVLLPSVSTAAEEPVADGAMAARAWRVEHERQILDSYIELLSIPNVADNLNDMNRNAEHIASLLKPRGFEVKLLRSGGSPAIYAERATPGAKKTVLLYVHYDGQAVDSSRWASDPFTPTLRDGPMGRIVDMVNHVGPFDPEWRVYARSAGDDKAPITAFVTAVDALASANIPLNVNLKLFFEGEEEQGSPSLARMLADYGSLLASDIMIIFDGPMHQSQRPQLVFGFRGDVTADLTVYGPLRPLHSGHYGNWAPNPGVALMELLTGMRDSEGNILIDGYLDTVRELSNAEREALGAIPNTDVDARAELALGRTEGEGAQLEELIMRPAFNVRGFVMGGVGELGRNAIETEAVASLDLRLAPDQTPDRVKESIEEHIRGKGYRIVYTPPDKMTRASHSKLIYVDWHPGGYPAYRAALDSPGVTPLINVLRGIYGDALILKPSTGASLPIYLFSDVLGEIPIVMLSLANHDNNQHGRDENMRLQNLWDAIETHAAILAGLYATRD